MNCPHCGAANLPEGARFCPTCGASLPERSHPLIAEKIIDYGDLIARRTKGFVGRDWLRRAVEDFLRADGKRYFLLSGEPGVGKTAFLAHLVTEQSYVHHFISSDDLNWLSPVAFAQSVGAQLAARFGAWLLEEDEAPPRVSIDMDIGTIEAGGAAIGVLVQQYSGLPVEELARKLILRPLRRLGERDRRPVVLTIDGLDEATSYSGPTTIRDLVAGLRAADNARVVLAANPGPALEDLAFQLEPAGLARFPLDGERPENLADVRACLEQALEEPAVSQAIAGAGLSAAEFVDQAVERSEGNFLYLTSLLDAIRTGQAGLNLSALPAGLSGHYRDQLRRIKQEAGREGWRQRYRPVMGVLAVARAPLTARQLADLAGLDRETVDEVLETASLFLDRRERPGALPAYRWYHRAFADFLTSEIDNPDDWFDPQRYHAQIADRIHARFPDPSRIDDEYALRNLAYHDRRAGPEAFPRLYALITPVARRAKRARFGSDTLFSQDLAEAIDAALDEGPAAGLPQLTRCGLIDATLGSMIADVPPELLRDLARAGQWARALNLAHLNAGRKGPGLQAIVEGLVVDATADNLDLAREVALQIPRQDDDAMNRAEALARVAAVLAEQGNPQAGALFKEAEQSTETIPGQDDRARALARIARLWAASDCDQAHRLFDAALTSAREMPVDADSGVREFASAANMVAQTAPEARWVIDHTPIDTIGAKARALADVAAELARAGDPRAEAVFTEAESVAAQIGSTGIEAVFAEHTADYIAARRRPAPDSPLPPVDAASLESRLQASERVPRDGEGFHAITLLNLARALLAAGEEGQARSVLERAIVVAEAADGGFQAKHLADAATLLRRAGDEETAGRLDTKVSQLADTEADLPTSYRAWLAERGREVVTTLREVAMTRAGFVKRRYYSDKALSQMAESLAAEDPDGAELLAEEIRDASLRTRAHATALGYLARRDDPGAGRVEQMIEETVRMAPEHDRDYLRAEAVAVLAPLYSGGARRFGDGIEADDLKVTALVEIGAALVAEGQAAAEVWDEAWQVAQGVVRKTATLARALARLGRHWAEAGDSRAAEAFTLALEAARVEPSGVERADALTQIAVAMSPSGADEARAILEEAEATARQLDGARARGRALSRIAGAQMDLDPARACHLLANLRRLGRPNFLDGLAQIVPGAATLGGAPLLWQIFEAIEQTSAFFA